MAHLTRSERDQIQALDRAGDNTQERIASIVGCSQSAVSREFSRYRTRKKKRYIASVAQKKAEERRAESYSERPRWFDDEDLKQHVLSELENGKSPDQIAGRMKYLKRDHTVSHQTIYNYIEDDKEDNGTLYKLLRYQGKKFKWRGFKKGIQERIPNRRDISERPKIVDQKKRFGDWESDLVVSCRSGSGAVATFAERTSMLFGAEKVNDQSADEFVRASHDVLDDIPSELRHTMTHDNGKEISKHEQITDELQIDVYCARPYHSWERGLNEFMNRELRRFFPKGTDFSKVTQKEIDSAVEWLNNCERRILNYRTPQEVYEEELEKYAFHA
jgi:transposase, IS30 family